MIEKYFKKHGIDKGSKLYETYYDFNISKAPQRAVTIANYIETKIGIHNLNGMNILDIGCGTGHVAAELSKRGANVCAIEKDKELVDIGNLLHFNNDTFLMCADFLSLELETSFDIILLIDVIEHTRHQKDFIIKAKSLLKQGGKLVIVTPNKLCPYDPEYGLLFVNYLPKTLANLYVKFFGRENTVGGKDNGFGVYPLTIFKLKNLMRSSGIIDLNIEIATELLESRSMALSNTLKHFKKNPLLLIFGSPLCISGANAL